MIYASETTQLSECRNGHWLNPAALFGSLLPCAVPLCEDGTRSMYYDIYTSPECTNPIARYKRVNEGGDWYWEEHK